MNKTINDLTADIILCDFALISLRQTSAADVSSGRVPAAISAGYMQPIQLLRE